MAPPVDRRAKKKKRKEKKRKRKRKRAKNEIISRIYITMYEKIRFSF